MKVVVTGGAGKAGRWVVRELAPAHDVTVFDRLPGPTGESIRNLPGDVVDLGDVMGALAGADAVIHLAAIPTHSVAPNEDTFRINCKNPYSLKCL